MNPNFPRLTHREKIKNAIRLSLSSAGGQWRLSSNARNPRGIIFTALVRMTPRLCSSSGEKAYHTAKWDNSLVHKPLTALANASARTNAVSERGPASTSARTRYNT